MNEQQIHILGFAGSLRRASYNAGLLRYARDVAPAYVRLELFDLSAVPLYNEDIEMPDAVNLLRAKVDQADVLLIATPEYNFSVSAVTKNALDWISIKAQGRQILNEKPVGLMGASEGPYGTVRAQLHLRAVFDNLNMHVLNRPLVHINHAKGKFDDEGNPTDDAARTLVRELIEALPRWAIRMRPQ